MKKRISVTGVVFVILTLLLLSFIVLRSLRRPPQIVLPPEEEQGESESASSGTGNERVVRIEVRPDTVQDAVATLRRPEAYSRTLTVERFFSAGSSISVITTSVADGWTRLDEVRSSGEIRHLLTDGSESYVWYGSDTAYYSGAAAFDADAELGIPTYETLLSLETEQITAADYRLLGETPCLYAETAEDAFGYTERYWVSVETGLLTAAEKRNGDELVYAVSASAPDLSAPSEEMFFLPQGTDVRT